MVGFLDGFSNVQAHRCRVLLGLVDRFASGLANARKQCVDCFFFLSIFDSLSTFNLQLKKGSSQTVISQNCIEHCIALGVYFLLVENERLQ